MSCTVTLSIWPTAPIVVSDQEVRDLRDQGLVIDSEPALPSAVLYRQQMLYSAIDEVLTDHPELGGGFDGVVDGGTA